MKLRLILTLSGLVIGTVMPAVGQDKNTVDPEVRQQIEAALTKFDEAFNKTMRLLLQPCTRRTRLRCGRDGRQVG
jgi:hypothetical protein